MTTWAKPSKFYLLPKIDKQEFPSRPIENQINLPTYKVAKLHIMWPKSALQGVRNLTVWVRNLTILNIENVLMLNIIC